MKNLKIIIPTVIITIVVLAVCYYAVRVFLLGLYATREDCFVDGPCIESGAWTCYRQEQNVKAIAVEGNNLWVGTEGGLVCMDKTTGKKTRYKYPKSGLPDHCINSIAVEGNIKWIGTRYGLAKFDGDRFIVYKDTLHSRSKRYNLPPQKNIIKSLLPSDGINAVMTYGSTKWIATDCGLAKFRDTTWTVYDANNFPFHKKGYYVKFPATTIEDSILWVEFEDHYENKLAKLDGTNWTLCSALPENNNIEAAAMAVEKDSSSPTGRQIWVGTRTGLAKFDGKDWTVYNTQNSKLPNNWITAIAVEGHTKWIGTHQRFVKFDGKNWTVYDEKNSKLPSNNVNVILIDGSVKWLGTRAGLVKLDGEKWTVYDMSSTRGIYKIICSHKMKKSKKYEDRMNRLSEEYGKPRM